jgi:hypothetical protein
MRTSLLISSVALLLCAVYIMGNAIEIHNLKLHNEYLSDTYIATLRAVMVEDDIPKATVLMHRLEDYYQKHPEIDYRKKESK